MLALGLFLTASAQGDYLAFAVGEGSKLPLPESIDAIDARYLVEVHWQYRGGRSPVVVLPVMDGSGARSTPSRETGRNGGTVSREGVPVDSIRGVVVDAMRQTGRFEMQGNPAGTDPPERVPPGGHTLLVTVANYEAGVRTRITNPRALRSGGPQVDTGRVALRMRLTGSNGNVVLLDRFEAVVEEPRPESANDVPIDGQAAEIWQTSIGKATLAAVNKGVYEIVKAVGRLPVSGRVVRAEDDRVWVNLGGDILAAGDELEVTAEGESLIDPETGLDLGGVETTLATLRVVEVQERFCIAEVLSATGTLSRGDLVRTMSAPTAFEFGPAWEPPE